MIDWALAVNVLVGITSVMKFYGLAKLVSSAGKAVSAAFNGLSKNRGVTVGLILITGTTGTLALLAYSQMSTLTSPILQNNATPGQEKESLQVTQVCYPQSKEHALLFMFFVSVVCVVFMGGIFMVCQINGGELKLEQVQLELFALRGQHDEAVRVHEKATMAHEKAIMALEAKHRLMLQNDTNSTFEQVKQVFKDMCNSKSPSIALVYNDTQKEVNLHVTHTWGKLGGAVTPRSYSILPGHFQVIEGNSLSRMLGAGVSVKRRDDGAGDWKTLSHMEIIEMKKVLPQEGTASKK